MTHVEIFVVPPWSGLAIHADAPPPQEAPAMRWQALGAAFLLGRTDYIAPPQAGDIVRVVGISDPEFWDDDPDGPTSGYNPGVYVGRLGIVEGYSAGDDMWNVKFTGGQSDAFFVEELRIERFARLPSRVTVWKYLALLLASKALGVTHGPC